MIDGVQWSRPQPSIDPAFVAGALNWVRCSEDAMLQCVWDAFAELERMRPPFDGRDLERSITERLEACIRRIMSGDEPFEVQH